MIGLGLEKLVEAVKPEVEVVESFDNQIEILSNIKAIVAEHGLSESVVAFIDSEDSLKENLDKSSSEAAQAHLEAIIEVLKKKSVKCDDDDDDDDDDESKKKKDKDEEEEGEVVVPEEDE